MWTIIILLIILILAIIIVPFTRQLEQDKRELVGNPINKKFEIIVSAINTEMLDGKGDITLFDKDPRLMNLMSDDRQNMLIQFYYSTGNLTITLKYKYYHHELIYDKQFSGVRNISPFMQKDIANQFMEECKKKITEHQNKVLRGDVERMSGIQNPTKIEEDPTNIVSSLYDDLTLSQKKSIANLMYLIGISAGADETKVFETSSYSQQILYMNVLPEDCIRQYREYGIDKVFEDLKSVDRGVLDMILFSCLSLMSEMNPSDSVKQQLMEDCFFQSFGKLGYTESDIEETIQKMVALQQTFGL